MITFKAIIIPGNRRKDGTYPVNIRVTFKGKSRRLATTLVCTPGDLTRSLKIKNPTILTRSDELIARMRNAVKDLSPFDLDSQDVDWVVGHIRDSLTKESFRLDFFKWSESCILTKTASTSNLYRIVLNSFERFLGKREIDINAITKPLLMDYADYLETQPKVFFHRGLKRVVESDKAKIPHGSVMRYMSRLEHLFNAAKMKYNDEDTGRILIPRSPFDKLDLPSPPPPNGQRNLGVDLMQRIISFKTDHHQMRTAFDIFIVSFGLMGVNVADLYPARPFNGQWVYNRKKTMWKNPDKAKMVVDLPGQLRPFLERLTGEGEWWLNNLHDFSTTKDGVSSKVNFWLRRWCEENEVEPFSCYAARHTWASLARNIGIDKSTIDDCLAHRGSFPMADIYAEKAWGLMTEANRKVLDLFTW